MMVLVVVLKPTDGSSLRLSRTDLRCSVLVPHLCFVPFGSVSSCSDKSKRRTKTVKKSVEPRWNQTFMYSPVHQREFKERLLELTVWDQARVRDEESQFLGEVRSRARGPCPPGGTSAGRTADGTGRTSRPLMLRPCCDPPAGSG